MKYDPLKIFLRSSRRRRGLSQADVAHIFGGAVSATSIARHETGLGLPTLRMLLKYEILYDASCEALFGELKDDVLEEMKPYIAGLIRKLERAKRQTTRGRLKIKHLKALLGRETNQNGV